MILEEDAKNEVNQWQFSQAVCFYEEGVEKLMSRYDKCLKIGGNYVE